MIGCAADTIPEPKTGAQDAGSRDTISQPGVQTLPPGVAGVRMSRIAEATKAALLIPLTGAHARLGQSLLNAAMLAVFDMADQKFALVVRDTGGTSSGARAALASALQSGAKVALGPLFADSALAISPEARAADVNVITFSNDSSIAGNNVFTMGHLPRAQVERVVDYANRQGLRRFAAMAPETPYGNAAVEALRAAVRRNDGTLSRVVFYSESTQDASAEVRALADYDARHQALLVERKQLAERTDEAARLALKRLEDVDTLGEPDFDALMLPEGGSRFLAIAPLLPFYDVDPNMVRLLGTALWDDQSLVSEPALIGGWFAAPSNRSWEVFRRHYMETFGEDPPRLASLAYDAVALAIVLAKGTDHLADPFNRNRITQPNGFSGVDGIFRFLPNGEIERGLAVYEVRRGGFRILDPAPISFEQLVN